LVFKGHSAPPAQARDAVAVSGGDGWLGARASQGRPGLPGAIGRALLDGGDEIEPTVAEGAACLKEASADAVALYGEALGVRCMRKHYASFIDWAAADTELAKTWRGRLCRAKTLSEAIEGLDDFSGTMPRREAA
jgi:tRNA-dihydrouridine synthase B